MQSSNSSSNLNNSSNSNNSNSNSNRAQHSSSFISSVHTRGSLSLLSWYVTNMRYVLASLSEATIAGSVEWPSYGLDNAGFESLQGQEIFLFPRVRRTALVLHVRWVPGLFLPVPKQPGHDGDSSPPSSAGVENECNCTSPPSVCPHGVHTDSLTFLPVPKQPGHNADSSPSSSAWVENEWHYTSAPSICLHGVHVDILTFLCWSFQDQPPPKDTHVFIAQGCQNSAFINKKWFEPCLLYCLVPVTRSQDMCSCAFVRQFRYWFLCGFDGHVDCTNSVWGIASWRWQGSGTLSFLVAALLLVTVLMLAKVMVQMCVLKRNYYFLFFELPADVLVLI
jgi:hypothetical protein